jgi:hypothetical protein
VSAPRPKPTGRRRTGRARQVRRRRTAIALILAAVVLVALIFGGGSSRHARTATGHTPSSGGSLRAGGEAGNARVVAVASGRLPAAVQDAAVAAISPDSALLIGGLDRGETSVTDIVRVSGSEAIRLGSLSSALHDASASVLGGQAYLFGGGGISSFSGITRITSAGQAQPAGRLPTPASDLAATTIDGTVYIVGGYTGLEPLRTVLAWRPGGAPARAVGILPKPLRYAAVAEQGGTLVIAGGTSGVAASQDVYRFAPQTGRVTTIARLPRPLTHAAAATLNGTVFVLGGRGATANSQTRRILAISPSGAVTTAGLLPGPLSDLAAVALGEHLVIAGGRDQAGRVSNAILTLSVQPRKPHT